MLEEESQGIVSATKMEELVDEMGSGVRRSFILLGNGIRCKRVIHDSAYVVSCISWENGKLTQLQ